MKKKYMAAAVVMSLTVTLSFGTIHAAAYADCDVNHDGVVDISDAVALNRYLGGDFYVSDYNRFDTNKSLTIDSADADKILAEIASTSYSAKYWDKENSCAYSFPTVSGFTPDASASSTASRTYRKYIYSTGQITTYSLTPVAAAFNSNSSPQPERGIIGIDDRIPSTGSVNTGIVHLQGADGSGTGFIVGDHVIATAAHVVYNNNSSGGYFNTTAPVIYPYQSDGTMSSTTFTPVEVHVPYNYGYGITADEKESLDYALITVSDDLSNYEQFSFGTTYNVTSSNYANIPLYVLGPDMIGSGSARYDLCYGQGNIVDHSTATNAGMLYYDCDTLAGESGSPLYTITRVSSGGYTYFYYTVIGIHTRNDSDTNNPAVWNAGVRITKYQLQFFNENPNISY